MVPQSRWVFRLEGPGKSWQCRCARGTVQKWELPALVFGMNNCGSLKAFKNRLGKSNMLLCSQPQNMDVVIRFYMLYMFIWLWAEGISIVIETYLHGYPLCPIIVPYVDEWTLLSELVDKKNTPNSFSVFKPKCFSSIWHQVYCHPIHSFIANRAAPPLHILGLLSIWTNMHAYIFMVNNTVLPIIQ